VIQGVADQMAGEIQRSLDFYAATAADNRIARVFLSGGTARIPALFKVIEARAGVPVELLNPFKTIDIDHKRFDAAAMQNAAPAAAVAVGLALRRAGDK
jgi:type IV pilus assembly protein PilM